MDTRKTIEELIDIVDQTLTINCTLPRILPLDAIRRIITFDALPYFYKKYKYALQRTYYYVDLQSMIRERRSDVKHIILPDEVEAVRWVYQVNYHDMRNLGYLIPQGSASMGMTSQPFVASLNISEWAQSVAVMQTFMDSLAMFSKNTLKFAYDPNGKRFELQTSCQRNLMLEVYAHIPQDGLFGDPLFIKYVTGQAMIELATRLSFNDMQLAGNSKINGDKWEQRGDKMVTEVKEDIAKITNSSFFFNKTR
jgi:hypothetical protein